MNMLESAGILLVGIVIGWQCHRFLILRAATNYLRSMGDANDDTSLGDQVPVTLSKEGDVFYMHQKDTGEFLAQGKNHEEIRKVLAERFPNTIFYAIQDNVDAVGYH